MGSSTKAIAGEMIYPAKETDWTFDNVDGELSGLEMNDQLIQSTDKRLHFSNQLVPRISF